MPTILAGTATGLLSFDAAGAERRSYLDGHDVRALAPASWTRLWAVVDRREVWCTGRLSPADQRKAAWDRVASLDDWPDAAGMEAQCIADTRANDPEGILVGASHARLLKVSGDGRLEPVVSFDQAPGRDSWYTPWGGPPDTRTITEDRETVFVNIHVGGVLRSRDQGATWAPTIDINADVHRVVTGAGRVYAAGARGLSVSDDGGDSWGLSAAGLHATYCRSVAVSGPALLLSASDGPGGGRAALYRSSLDADAFERCQEGLPRWFQGNIDSLCLDALPNGALAAFATETGEVYASADGGSAWRRLAEGLASVRCVLVLP